MWSGATSGQNLLRHIPGLTTSPTDGRSPCPLGLAWPVVATEESVGDTVSHFLAKYLNPDHLLRI